METSETNPGGGGPGRSRRPLPRKVERVLIRCVHVGAVVLFTWVVLAYVVLPAVWRHYDRHPVMENAPKTTWTAIGVPGDPLNVGFFGAREDLDSALLAAGWFPADPVTWKSSLRIASSVVLKRPYPEAPISPLYLFGRTQDQSFEKGVGGDARRRHHVRFWKSTELGRNGAPLWIGAATFDDSVGLSRRTGQITHHIAPDVDAERDALIADLVRAGRISRLFQVTGIGSTLVGRNGGGDWYYTDGELTLGVLVPPGAAGSTANPETLANPPVLRIKEQFWDAARPLLRTITTPLQNHEQGQTHDNPPPNPSSPNPPSPGAGGSDRNDRDRDGGRPGSIEAPGGDRPGDP